MKRRVLIVDDEAHITELLEMSLRQHGYDALAVLDGSEAQEAAASYRPDIILLDLMIPGIGGLELCRIFRQTPTTADLPIIMVSAKSEETDKVIGLGIGADDYVTKPFSIRELMARVEAALRRGSIRSDRDKPRSGQSLQNEVRFELGDASLVLNPVTRSARLNDSSLSLSPAEFQILSRLVKTPGQPAERGELIEGAGLSDDGKGGRSLDVHVRHLRQKLAEINRSPEIRTIRGVGYAIDV